MYPKGKGANPVVVAEEWFIVTNDDDVQIDRQICKATEDNCKQHCNKKYNIKKDFKAKIRKYVETNTKNNQIIRIEKLKKQHILDNDIVMIKYKSYRVVSKIEYKGYNINRKNHFLTNDWVELNFREDHEAFWKEVTNLKPGSTNDWVC